MSDLQRQVGAQLLRAVQHIERAEFLDPATRWLAPAAEAAGSPRRLGGLLLGRWLGHSFHPLLTDFTEGAWMGASLLDLVGPPNAAPAARRLLAFGTTTAIPTYLSGLVEFTVTDDEEARRVGLVHAIASFLALGLYAGSYVARLKGRHRRGVWLGVAGGVVALLDGYLGGHLGHVVAVDVGVRGKNEE